MTCLTAPGIVMCTAGPLTEVRRTPYPHARWCFTCRERTTFDYVVFHPSQDASELDGPEAEIQCHTCRTTDSDLFPGNFRPFIEPYGPENKLDPLPYRKVH